ncbi:hypothetical protein CHH69_18145, partial [Terribacillus saccharophilus]
ITQTKHRNVDYDLPTLFIGNSVDAYKKIQERHSDDMFIQTLARDNLTSNAMKFEVDNSNLKSKLFVELASKDNTQRYNVIKSTMEALEFVKHSDYKSAIKSMSNNFADYSGKEQFNKSVSTLQRLMKKQETFFEKPLMIFYQLVREDIKMSGFRKGAAQDFYNTYSYKELALCINYTEDVS